MPNYYHLLIGSIDMRYFYYLAVFLVLSPVVSNASPTIAEMQTTLGTITIRLSDKAPITIANFISYASKGAYDHNLFHRSIKDFVVQGGGFDALTGGPIVTDPAIASEANNGLKNITGTIAMARTSNPNSATSQFFINLVDNAFLDFGSTQNPNGYTVFGNVISGLSVVNEIANYSTRNFSDNCTNKGSNFCGNLYSSLPVTDNGALIYIERVYLSEMLDPKHATIRITANSSQGRVISSPAGIKCGIAPNACATSKLVSNTKKLELRAIPYKNYIFNGWRGDCKGYASKVSVDLKTNHNCTATFVKATP